MLTPCGQLSLTCFLRNDNKRGSIKSHNHFPLLTDSLKHNKTFAHSVLFEEFVQRSSPGVFGLAIWLADDPPLFHG